MTESYNFITDNIEFYIVKQLFDSDVYARSFITRIEPDLFSAKLQDTVRGIQAFFKKTSRFPSTQVLLDVVIPKLVGGDQTRIDIVKESLLTIDAIKVPQQDMTVFITDETKKFIKNRMVMKAFAKSLDLVKDGKHDEMVATMEQAFRLNFDESIGLNYFQDLESRMARSLITHEIISTGLPNLDRLMGGGYRRKALFVYAGPGNVGKSLVLNDAASTLALNGYNVVYLSLELAEDYISQRTDAKFAEVSMNMINAKPDEAIKKAIARRDIMKQEGKKLGQLIYKDYPPGTASCNDIRALLKILETKSDFKPDFIIIDYIKLLKTNGKVFGDSLYHKLDIVCQEMRALGIEYNACVLSASQTGRQTYGSASVGMEDVSDSIAIAQTADVLVTLARNTTLNKEDAILLSLVKSRFSRNEGQVQAKIDYDYMRLLDIHSSSTYQGADEKVPVPTPFKKEVKPKPKEDNDFLLEI